MRGIRLPGAAKSAATRLRLRRRGLPLRQSRSRRVRLWLGDRLSLLCMRDIDHPATECHKLSASRHPTPGDIMSEYRARSSRNARATPSESPGRRDEEPRQRHLLCQGSPPRATASQHQIASCAGASRIFTVSTGDRKKEPQISSERSCTWGISKLGSPMQRGPRKAGVDGRALS
jgi:hypothetical protein